MNLVSYGEGNWYVGSADESEKWQWQPSLTAHDPSPPITLEDAAVVGTFNAAMSGATHVAGVVCA